MAILIATTPIAYAQEEPNPDPWEGMNRGTFRFNEGLDRWVMEPVATAWDFVMPELVERGFTNFFDNFRTPVVLVNNTLQLKPARALEDFGRIFLNTSLGIGGLFDVATALDVPRNYQDFGLTLGHYHVPTGPYLVLPLLGPSNPRDTAGRVVDAFIPYLAFMPFWGVVIFRTTEMVNLRAQYLEEFAEERAGALDFYVFLRDAYTQNRRFKLYGDDPPRGEDDDLYFYEDDEDLYEDPEAAVEEGGTSTPSAGKPDA